MIKMAGKMEQLHWCEEKQKVGCGWMEGQKSRFKDCLQQSKIVSCFLRDNYVL